MSPLAAKILIIGVPLALSLAWFVFWVVRLSRAARRIKSGSGTPREPGPPAGGGPAGGGPADGR